MKRGYVKMKKFTLEFTQNEKVLKQIQDSNYDNINKYNSDNISDILNVAKTLMNIKNDNCKVLKMDLITNEQKAIDEDFMNLLELFEDINGDIKLYTENERLKKENKRLNEILEDENIKKYIIEKEKRQNEK
jgi:hypothetical protein